MKWYGRRGEEQRALVISLFVKAEKTSASNGELMMNLVIAVLLRLTFRMGEQMGRGWMRMNCREARDVGGC